MGRTGYLPDDCCGRRLLRKGGAIELLIAAKTCGGGVTTILWIIAAISVIGEIVTFVRGAILSGIVLIIVDLLIGPGGVSVCRNQGPWTRRAK